MLMQVRAVEGKGRKAKDFEGKGLSELMQAEKERDDTMQLAEKKKDKQCFCCQKRGHIKRDCRYQQRDMKKARERGKPFVDGKQYHSTENC